MRGAAAILLGALLASGCSVERAGAPDREADIAELTRIKQVDWNGYYRNRDADGLAAFLSDEFIVLDADGSLSDKVEAIDYVRNNDWPLATRNFEYEVTQVQFVDDDTANVFGRGTYDSDECRMGYTSSNILRRGEDGWHPVFSHTSPSACIEPGDDA